MKFSLDQAEKKGLDGVDYWVYSTRDQFVPASAAYFEVTGGHGLAMNTVCDRVYYVISGTGEFILAGEALRVAQSDVVIVPKGTEYDFWADSGQTLKLFLVNTPAFDPESETRMDR
jgi:mannose-6-phosphate isomerase-like protein (cupin superfamily)